MMISKNPTRVNQFSPELWSHLSTSLSRIARENRGRKIAAFDADGTLWDADAGETFFDWQIKHSGLKDLPPDPWAHYLALKKPDPRVAYAWLAQINAGQSLRQVRAWAQTCFDERPDWPVFDSQKKLLDLLRSLDFEIFIVTASVKWAVEPVAKLVGVDFDHVLGVETRIYNGAIGKEVVRPITWREGKADGLLLRTGGLRPLIACGNTLGDIALIDTSTEIRLGVSTQDQPGSLLEEEKKLIFECEKRGWLRHAFRGK